MMTMRTTTSKKLWVRRSLKLRRADGQLYLQRWGIVFFPRFEDGYMQESRFGVYVHRMTAPDPGIDLHDHPWPFWSLILKGGYTEEYCQGRVASQWAKQVDLMEASYHPRIMEKGWHLPRGYGRRWTAGSWHRMGLETAHRIRALNNDKPCWSLVIRGKQRRDWGFYTPDAWLNDGIYDMTVRAERRDLWNEA